MNAAKKVLPDAVHCAIMDTAWHQTMPEHVYLYALPHEWYKEYEIRRYGFHGTSFLYTSKRAAVLLGKDPFNCNLIICHFGNGVSVNAVSMVFLMIQAWVFTPLEGLYYGNTVRRP